MLRLLLGLILASSFATALYTTAEFNASLKTVDKLVQVDADFVFPKLLPGAQYLKDVSVRWALPDDALRDLKSDVVRIHVVAYALEPSWLLFSNNDKLYRVYAFELTCRVVQGRCTQDSQLQHSFQAVLSVPLNASFDHAERFFVQASLSEDYPSIAVSTDDSFSQRVQEFFDNLPIQGAGQIFQNLVQPANTALTPKPVSSGTTAADFSVNVNSKDSSGSTSVNGVADAFLSAQVAAQPAGLPPGKQNISPIAGLVVTRDDAVFYGGAVVLFLLAVLFYKRFLAAQRFSGLMEA